MPSGVVVTDGLQPTLGSTSGGTVRSARSSFDSGDPHMGRCLGSTARPRCSTTGGWARIMERFARSIWMNYYLDECTFRFNRRASRSREKLFYRWV